MPYSEEHKKQTRSRIVESARRLFNRRGFSEVSIDEIMAAAGLTRGGFYNHFSSKEDLFAEAIQAYAACNRAKDWDGVQMDFSAPPKELAQQLLRAYLSHHHLADVEGHCPMIALPSDVARGSAIMKASYQTLFEGMVQLLAAALTQGGNGRDARKQALALASTMIGAMVLARTFADEGLAEEVRASALEFGQNALRNSA